MYAQAVGVMVLVKDVEEVASALPVKDRAPAHHVKGRGYANIVEGVVNT